MIIKRKYYVILLILLGCGGGGPLTPLESFNFIKNAVDKNDSSAIINYLNRSSLDKINKHNQLVKDLRADQITMLSEKYGYSADTLKNIKNTDSVALYFFSDAANIRLGRYFKEKIVSMDIDGNRAQLKTESGIELDFTREGPYWKFDISNL